MSEAEAQETGQENGVVTGGVNIILRLEGLTLFAGMVLLYAMWGGSWWLFGVLFFIPDLSFAAYLTDPRTGAIFYNAAHCYMVPVSLMIAGFLLPDPLTLSIAFIWMAHIGIDRALGYGLKYQKGFGFTHLGRIGRKMAAKTT